MRGELRRVADLTAHEQSALRTLALADYPPEVAVAWPHLRRVALARGLYCVWVSRAAVRPRSITARNW